MRNEIYSRVTSLLTQDSVLANWGDTSVNLVLKKKKIVCHELACEGPEFQAHTEVREIWLCDISCFVLFQGVSPLSLHYLGGYSSFRRRDKLSRIKRL